MGNRAVIATEERDLGVYLHWNGGRDSVEAFLAYCKLRGFRAPEKDCYGWARLCQVVANYFGGNGLSIGIDRYECLHEAGDDNGVYIIKDWEIVERIYPFSSFEEQREYEFAEMLRSIDAAQPEGQRIGGFFDGEGIPTSF